MRPLVQFIHGATAMGCGVVALFMLWFWKRTRERLFLLFSLAFWAFLLNWTLLGILVTGDEARHFAYVARLGGFLLILTAVVDKNLSGRGPGQREGGLRRTRP